MVSRPWNDATDRQLLLVIIHLTGGQLPKWDQVAALMGGGFTAESTRQHFQKLRKESKTEFGDLGDAGKDTPANAATTSGKAKSKQANGSNPSKSTGKRKATKAAAEMHSEDEDEENPLKKRAVGTPGVKVEEFS